MVGSSLPGEGRTEVLLEEDSIRGSRRSFDLGRRTSFVLAEVVTCSRSCSGRRWVGIEEVGICRPFLQLVCLEVGGFEKRRCQWD